MPLPPNTRLGRYEVRSQLGAGGMGEVYLAEDTKLDRKVALKFLPTEFAADKERMNRFVREAKSASALNHPNIITIYEIGEIDSTHFIAAEYITGETLHTRLTQNPLDVRTALDVAIQVASALDAAHRAGIVHRDIKPDNVMIRPDGLVKILDFGIAKLSEPATAAGGSRVDEEAATAIKPESTSPGMVIGTANYMSPEQARGKEVDARTDVFSFGILFYEMLTLRRAFGGENALDVIGAILHKEPTPLRQVLPELPTEIERIVNKALRKDRDERYQTARDLLTDLKDAKQELEFQDKLHRTSAPHAEEVQTQMLSAPTSDVPHTTSSAEFISREIGKHRRGVAVASVVLLSAIIGLGYWYASHRATSIKQINSIAVMPFENKSSDADTEYLSDGLAESLIYRLSQLPDLKVSPTSSVFSYKGKATDPQTIAKELVVDSVMTGRITQRGNNLTISVNLVDTRNGKSLWGEQYERKMSELLATQREIAAEITSKLQLKLSGADTKGLTKRYTNNDEAYQFYLKGRYHFAKRTKSDILKAVEYFQQAITLDPNYALAYAGLADCYNGMIAYPYLSPKEAIPRAKTAAKRALEIDPMLAEAHTALANSLACFDWNWEEAEREFKRAIELNPNDSGTHWRYGMFYLMVLGRSDESIVEVKRAVDLEPLNLNNGANLSGAYFHARQNDKAYDEAKQVFDLDPNFIVGRWALSQASIMKGMYADVIALNEQSLQTDPMNQVFLRFAGLAYAKAGRRQEAEGIIRRYRELAKTQYVMSYHIAVIYSALGEKEKAFAELEKAFEEHDYLLPRLKVEPFLDPLRDDPRFKDLLKRVNLPE